MRSDRPSRTAEYMALFRAVETCQPKPRRLFDDPYAVDFLSGWIQGVARLAAVPVVGRIVPWILDVGWPSTRSSGVVRTRLIDDALEEALDRGIEQLVLLGAGLDSRPYRLLGRRPVRVFEVDHPATQRAKCERLTTSLGALPPQVRYLPVDFERDDLRLALEGAGFDSARRSVFVWEGVVSYLTTESVERNFTLLSSLMAAGSRLVFTYVHRGALDGSSHFAEAARWSGWVRFSGEPFTFGFTPEELPAYLEAHGFATRADVSTAEAAQRYCPPLGRSEPGSQLYRIVIAERA